MMHASCGVRAFRPSGPCWSHVINLKLKRAKGFEWDLIKLKLKIVCVFFSRLCSVWKISVDYFNVRLCVLSVCCAVVYISSVCGTTFGWLVSSSLTRDNIDILRVRVRTYWGTCCVRWANSTLNRNSSHRQNIWCPMNFDKFPSYW